MGNVNSRLMDVRNGWNRNWPNANRKIKLRRRACRQRSRTGSMVRIAHDTDTWSRLCDGKVLEDDRHMLCIQEYMETSVKWGEEKDRGYVASAERCIVSAQRECIWLPGRCYNAGKSGSLSA